MFNRSRHKLTAWVEKTIFLAAKLSFFSFLLAFEASATTFSKMYVFGDSTSDMGNQCNATTSALEKGLITGNEIAPPSPPYFEGRYSTGLVWVEPLADKLGLDLIPSSKLAIDSPIIETENGFRLNLSYGGATATRSVNFAVWGAGTGFYNANPTLAGMLTQTQAFIKDLESIDSRADPEGLYVVLGGLNDYLQTDNPNPQELVGNIEKIITLLYNAGARNFLVGNLPDVGQFPIANLLGAETATNITNLIKEHNFLLETSFAHLDKSLSEINILPLDLYFFVKDSISNPKKYGYTNVTDPCISGEFPEFSVCEYPNDYLFADLVHGTNRSYENMADFALEQITSKAESAPEPSSLLSLGLLGMWLLRKEEY